MKIISLNVGLFEANNKKINEFLKKENPDIICFQEVTKKIDRSANGDFITKDTIDESTPLLNHSFYAPLWVLHNFEQYDFHGKEHFMFELGGKVEFGNYIRSKHEITFGKNVFLQNDFTYITDWSNWPQEDYRAIQVVDVLLEDDGLGGNSKKLRLLNYHGIWSRDKKGTDLTKQACEKIKKLALEVDHPSIICGDFNLFPDTESMQVFYDGFSSLVDNYKIKTTRPDSNELQNKGRNVVDYVLVSKGVNVKSFSVPKSDVSDHLPQILEFEI